MSEILLVQLHAADILQEHTFAKLLILHNGETTTVSTTTSSLNSGGGTLKISVRTDFLALVFTF